MIGFQFIIRKAVNYNNPSNIYFNIRSLKKPLFLVMVFIALITNISTSFSANGGEYGVGRMRSCDSNGNPEGLDFNPTDAGKDVEFILTNPTCLIVISTTYATVKVAIMNMNKICQTGSSIPRIIPTPLNDFLDIERASYKASSQASKQDYSCLGAVTGAGSAFATALLELGIIYGIAKNTYNKTEVCGFGWKKANPQQKDFSSKGKEAKVNLEIQKRLREFDKNPYGFDRNKLGLDGLENADQTYREWYYGGVEVEDKLPDSLVQADSKTVLDKGNLFADRVCRDPTRQKRADGNYPPQRYYMQGLEAGNFNCDKYKPINDKDAKYGAMLEAYHCCRERSRNFICIDHTDIAGNNNKKVFCKAGQLCDINGITFSTKSIEQGRIICAETYSLCPYNFSLSGGTEYCNFYQDGNWNKDFKRWQLIGAEDLKNGNCENKSEIRNSDCTYNDKAGKCKNYCQFLTHCTKTSSIPFEYKTTIGSPYFSTACLNFVGDSQNKVGYSSQKHFSAPIAQCMKETLENVFYNRIGHSVCEGVNEYPNENGVCPGAYAKTIANYDYKEGGKFSVDSFFEILQDKIENIVRLTLVLSVTFFGMNILTGKANIRDKKVLIIYVLKISLIMYFTLSNAWQTKFFDGLYGASTSFANLVFNINSGGVEQKLDGCQFGEITLPNGTKKETGFSYPKGKEYLAIFDTLDCKLMRYLGFGPTISEANIAKLIFAGFFSLGGIGIFMSMSIFIFGFFMLAAVIRALHIFLSSLTAIILMVFISPLIIPLVLFEKTNNIFKGWLKQLISFTLQPMILFAYTAIFIVIMDKTLIGSATFVGSPPFKKMSCEENCYFKDTGEISMKDDFSQSDCTGQNEEFINPLNDSVACIIGIDKFKKWPGLSWIGISIPMIDGSIKGDVKKRVLTLIKAALVMALLYFFMDEINGMASQLIGGAELPGSKANPLAMFAKIVGTPSFSFKDGFQTKGGVVNMMQQRATRGTGKLAMSQGKKALDAIKKQADKGKGTESANSEEGKDSAGSEGSSGKDSASAEKK